MESEENARQGLTERQAFWLRHLRNCQEAGESLKDYAEQHGLGLASIYAWNRKFQVRGDLKPSSSLRFRRIEIAQPKMPSVFRIRLPNAVMVEWPGDGELSALEGILKIVARV